VVLRAYVILQVNNSSLMGMVPLICPLLFLCLTLPLTGAAQESPQVLWSFRAECVQQEEVIVIATAHILPGWQLHSQQEQGGDPPSLIFSFDHSDAYVPIGPTLKRSGGEKLHTERHEIGIVEYSGKVYFIQKVKLIKVVSAISGTIECLISKDRVIMPVSQEFNITINPDIRQSKHQGRTANQ
jgi:hypothetical protein